MRGRIQRVKDSLVLRRPVERLEVAVVRADQGRGVPAPVLVVP